VEAPWIHTAERLEVPPYTLAQRASFMLDKLYVYVPFIYDESLIDTA